MICQGPFAALISNISTLGQKLRNIKSLRESFQAKLEEKGLKEKGFPKIVPTRWCSEHRLMAVFVKLYYALSELKLCGKLEELTAEEDLYELIGELRLFEPRLIPKFLLILPH